MSRCKLHISVRDVPLGRHRLIKGNILYDLIEQEYPGYDFSDIVDHLPIVITLVKALLYKHKCHDYDNQSVFILRIGPRGFGRDHIFEKLRKVLCSNGFHEKQIRQLLSRHMSRIDDQWTIDQNEVQWVCPNPTDLSSIICYGSSCKDNVDEKAVWISYEIRVLFNRLNYKMGMGIFKLGEVKQKLWEAISQKQEKRHENNNHTFIYMGENNVFNCTAICICQYDLMVERACHFILENFEC